MEARFSSRLLVWVLAAMLGGTLLLYALPAIDPPDRCPSNYYSCQTLSFSQAALVMRDPSVSAGWLIDLTKIGVLVTLVALFALPASRRTDKALCISLGALAACSAPLWIVRHLHGYDPGYGVVLSSLAFLSVAAAPWVLLRKENEWSAATPNSSSMPQTSSSSMTSSVHSFQRSAAAASTRTLSARSSIGEPGNSTHINGSGFPADQKVIVEWVGMHGTRALGEVIATTTGEVDLVATTPLDQPPGEYTIRAITPNGLRATAAFTLLS